jgi:hypothetical protein
MLTDLEYRVWTQYLLTSDDFGVMRATAAKIQADNGHLANRPAKVIIRCLDALVKCGLVREFTDQGHRFIYSHNWQTYQKVEYPRATDNPRPPADHLEQCDEPTRELFTKHPGGLRATKARRERAEDVPKVSQTNPEGVPTTRAGAPAERLTANGLRHTANGERPASLVQPRRRDAAFEYGRLYVPQRAHADLLALHAPDFERELFTWYAEVGEVWTHGTQKDANPGADMIRFWKAQHDARWPPATAPRADDKTPAWVQRAKAVNS